MQSSYKDERVEGPIVIIAQTTKWQQIVGGRSHCLLGTPSRAPPQLVSHLTWRFPTTPPSCLVDRRQLQRAPPLIPDPLSLAAGYRRKASGDDGDGDGDGSSQGFLWLTKHSTEERRRKKKKKPIRVTIHEAWCLGPHTTPAYEHYYECLSRSWAETIRVISDDSDTDKSLQGLQ